MIKIVSAAYQDERKIDLKFSTGERGTYDLQKLIEREGAMVRPLRDPIFFRDFFLELGALAWKNGFELSPAAIYEELRVAGLLRADRAA